MAWNPWRSLKKTAKKVGTSITDRTGLQLIPDDGIKLWGTGVQDTVKGGSGTDPNASLKDTQSAAAEDVVPSLVDAVGSEFVPTFQVDPGIAAGGQNVIDLANRVISGEELDVSQNPYLQAAIQSAINPVTANLVDQIIPRIAGDSALAGAFGGTGHGGVEQTAVDDYIRQVSGISGAMHYDAYKEAKRQQLEVAPQMLYDQLQVQLIEQGMAKEDAEREANRLMLLFQTLDPGYAPPEPIQPDNGLSMKDILGLGILATKVIPSPAQPVAAAIPTPVG